MKVCFNGLAVLFLLSGCSVNIITDKFIYRDDKVEEKLDLIAIDENVVHDSKVTKILEVPLTTVDGVKLKDSKIFHENARINIILFGGSGMKISQSAGILNKFAL